MSENSKVGAFVSLARRLFYLFAAFLVLLVVVFSVTFLFQSNPQSFISPKPTDADWSPKSITSAISEGWSDREIEYGYHLVTESPIAMGPKAKNPKLRYSGNNLTCTNCHLDAGTRPGAAAWVGVTDRFPQFDGRSNTKNTLESRINGCMERSMDGKKLPDDSREMQAIIAYMKWLSEDVPDSRRKEFEGFVKLEIPEVAVDLIRGEQLYAKECMVCHGANGQGQRYADTSKGYQYPPLWGPDSYNNGAGMHRVLTAAQFIKANMPFGNATAANPKLTDEEAFHVAGYINSFERPSMSDLQLDYPDKKLKPVSSPYGPWADDFSALQHKYGPYPPIVDYYRTHYNIKKTK